MRIHTEDRQTYTHTCSKHHINIRDASWATAPWISTAESQFPCLDDDFVTLSNLREHQQIEMEKAAKPSGQQTQDSAPSSPKSPCFRACLILAECLKLCRVTWNSEVMVCPSPAARSPASIEAEARFVLWESPRHGYLSARYSQHRCEHICLVSSTVVISLQKWAVICYKVVKPCQCSP